MCPAHYILSTVSFLQCTSRLVTSFSAILSHWFSWLVWLPWLPVISELNVKASCWVRGRWHWLIKAQYGLWIVINLFLYWLFYAEKTVFVKSLDTTRQPRPGELNGKGKTLMEWYYGQQSNQWSVQYYLYKNRWWP